MGLPWAMTTQGWFRRWVAGGVVDFLIVTVPFALLTGFDGFLVDWLIRGSKDPLGVRDPGVTFVQWVGWGLALSVYFVAFELRFATTPGKRLFGMRVVGTDGFAPPTSAIAVCNFLKVPVLILPILQLITLVAICFREDDRRLGDLAARTCVVCVTVVPEGRPTSTSSRQAPQA